MSEQEMFINGYEYETLDEDFDENVREEIDGDKLEKLIESVRKNPELYDTDHEQNKAYKYKEEIWAKIAAECGLSNPKKTWQNLRDCHRDAIKRRHSGASAKKWKYQDAMTYLEPFIVKRDSLPNSRKSSTFEEESKSNVFLENDPKMKKLSKDNKELLQIIRETQKPQETQPTPQYKEKQTLINKEIPEQRNSRPSNPALYNFFITMYETALTFPPNLQTEVKRKLFNILSDYEEKAAGISDEIFGI